MTQTPKHLRILNKFLIDIAQRKITRAIITFPPRHGKSETASKLFPAWYLGMCPSHRVMLVSYAAEYAATWGRKTRDILEEWGPQLFNVRIRDDVRARDAWELQQKKGLGGITGGAYTNSGGGMVTTGIGGPLTGRGGDLIIIDDPIKNSEEAFSPTIRQKQWDWFISTLMSRKQPKAVVVLIMTRWHEDDLAGRLITNMEAGGEHWEVLNFPALATEADDLLGRDIGDALWPEQYSREVLEETRENAGSYWFSAMYQQQPIPAKDAVFKMEKLRRYSVEGKNVPVLGPRDYIYVLHSPDGSKRPIGGGTIFTTVDLAVSLKETADYTVVSTWLETPDKDLLLLDVRKIRLEGPDQTPLMLEVYHKFRPAIMHVEKTGFQLAIIQAAQRAGLPIMPYTPVGDKMARALAPAAKMEAGKVYFPYQAPWLKVAESEMAKFPADAHDDFVDTLSMAAIVSLGAGYVGNLG